MSVSDIILSSADFLEQIVPFLAVFAILVNSLHLLILTRKSVTSSSMKTLLIGIAIVDILSPMVFVKKGVELVWALWNRENCAASSYHNVLADLILFSLSENFRRCSTWLGLLLAVTRTISVKMATNGKWKFLSDSRFGVILILGTLFFSFPILIPLLIRYQIVESAPISCMSSSGSSNLMLNFKIVEFMGNKIPIGGSARAIHILLTGIFGQLIPSILFPIFAGILIFELRNPEKKNSKTVNTDKISKMVIYMTVTFLFIEFPIGIGKIWNSMQTESTIPHDFNQIFRYLYVPMTFFHCFICFSMSAQYRLTASQLFHSKCIPKKTKTSIGNASTILTTIRF